MHVSRRLAPAVLCALVFSSQLHAATFSAAADRADGVYAPGSTVQWTVTWDGPDAPPPARYRILAGQLSELAAGTLEFTGAIAR